MKEKVTQRYYIVIQIKFFSFSTLYVSFHFLYLK